jgi:syntaxin 8
MRRANQDVMLMQRQMIDSKLSPLLISTSYSTDSSFHDAIDQDEQLDALAKAIARQRDLSLNISSELELHEELIEETDRALDQ